LSRGRYDQVLRWTLLVAGVLMLFMVLDIFRRPANDDNWMAGGGPRIGVVEIKGLIYDSRKVVRQLDRFARQRNIDAILVRIDSPGGTVAASQEIYSKLRKIRDEGDKPVIVSMGSVAASGGVYISLGADTIMAAPGTATGSIGVILDYPVATGLLEKLGLEIEVIKTGPLKDAGSPYRDPTELDRQSFRGVIDDMFDQFIETIVEERQLTEKEVRKLATGEIYTGRQALELGLIDLLGTYEDAVNLAGSLTGSTERPSVVRPVEHRRRSVLEWFIGDLSGEIVYPQLVPQYRMR
jgi:protease-4